MLDRLLALAVPPACTACRVPLAAAADPLCPACRRALPWLPAARCPRCALPSPCAPCPAARAPWTAAWAPLAYAGPARALVAALKFRGATALADLMAAQMIATAPPGLLDGAALVPVPADRGRRRARGFDHAERLGRALAARTGRPLRRCLIRDRGAGRQLGAVRQARLAPGRVRVRARRAPPPVAVLVDDVHTTGATLAACARALRAAGAGEVRALCYARTL